jgi:hypothetical protein
MLKTHFVMSQRGPQVALTWPKSFRSKTYRNEPKILTIDLRRSISVQEIFERP